MAITADQIKGYLANKWVQLAASFLAGALMCTLLYPTKTIDESVKQQYQQTIDKLTQEQKDTVTSYTKQLDEQASKIKTLNEEYQSKVTQLTNTITEMSSHKVATTHKIIRADGSSEEWTSMESEDSTTEKIMSELRADYDKKIAQSESEWQKKVDIEVSKTSEQYKSQIVEMQKTISKLESEKVTTINAKKFGVELGATSDLKAYLHTTYDLWGPVFIGATVEGNQDSKAGGLGIGIRF